MITVSAKIKDRITKGLKKFQPVLRKAQNADLNESDTVTIITDIMCEIFGYEKYKDIIFGKHDTIKCVGRVIGRA